MNDKTLLSHWRDTKNLMIYVLLAWFFFAYLIHFFVGSLNDWLFLGFPLGYYMASQGSLLAFVVLIFVFAMRQNKIDEKHDMHEGD